MTETKKKDKKKLLLLLILLLVLIAGIVAFAVGRGGQSSGASGIAVEKNTVDWTQDMNSSDESAEIQVPYYSDIYMKNGSDEIDMYLVNPKENNCYFSYTLVLTSSNKEIYQSGLIQPGKAVEKVTLNQKMGAGTYDLDLRIHTYTLEDQKPLNNALVSTKLIVQ